MRDDRLHALYAVGLAVGLRRGELLALGWADVDLADGLLRVRQTLQRLPGQGLVFGPYRNSRPRLLRFVQKWGHSFSWCN